MRRSVLLGVSFFLPLLSLHCSSSSDSAFNPGKGYTKDSGPGDGAGKDVQVQDQVVKDTTGQDTVVVAPDATDATSEPVGPPPCTPGLTECKNNQKKVCQPDGTWGAAEDCGTKICSNLMGCVTCLPGTGTCTDANTAHKCLDDGTGYYDESCDPDLGSACDQATGMCTGPCAAGTLGKNYIGCEYYPTVTLNSQIAELGGFDQFHFAIAVSNTSATPATLKITQGGTAIVTQDVAASSVQVIFLPWTDLRTATGATTMLASGAYRLRSTQPVTVYQFNPLEFCSGGYCSYANDASLLLPVNAWGIKYMVASRNTWEWNGFNLPGFYTVVASQDGTTVTLAPSATGSSVRGGAGVGADGNGSVTLNRGDALQVLSGTPTSADLTGTMVSSDKPIEVFGGHACTFVPANVGYCDHLEESMFPVSTLSTQYVVSPPSLPSLAQPKPFFVRAIAVEAGTSLQYDPPNAAWPASLANTGDYIELDSGVDFKIKADKRILVSQYMKGQDAGGGSGDPAMALAVTTGQFRKDYLFHSPVNYTTNYVNVTAPDGALVTLDGQPVAGFATVGATGYSVARVMFPNGGDGNHRITCPQPIGISVYGYGDYTSYWYPGGLNLSDL